MSCGNEKHVFPYRWKHATIEIRACRKHAEEIMGVLREVDHNE